MKLSLRMRILLPCLSLAALSTLLISYTSYKMAGDGLTASIIHQLKQQIASTQIQFDSWITDRQLDFDNFSNQKVFQMSMQDSFIGKSARKSANVDLEQIAVKYGFYENMSLTDTNGNIIASSDTNMVGKINISDRAYFKDCITGKSSASSVVLSKVSNNPVFVLASPLKVDGRVIGTFFGSVKMFSLSDIFIDPVKLQGGGCIYMVDSEGIIIAHPDKKKIWNVKITDKDWGKEILKASTGTITFQENGTAMFAAYTLSKKTKWTAIAVLPQSETTLLADKVGRWNLIIGLGSMLLTLLFVLRAAKSIVLPLNQLVQSISQNASQVANGANQISSSSHSLAEGTSEQAASLEETSSSLEEMSSMTRNNADNTRKANEIAQQARQAAEKGASSMNQMNEAMRAIQQSSDDISKIIKTIDEIAFQTNILALNAAVEAARAGESGLGFAVVAEEVRNLAQRSAQAAKETSAKIEGSVTRTHQGVQISEQVASVLSEIVEKVQTVDHLVAEVTAASQEQTQGIEQVTTAVGEMDKVTQSNAANAEESASAAETLSAQSRELNEAVALLQGVINGTQTNSSKSASSDGTARPKISNSTEKHIDNPVSTKARQQSPALRQKTTHF